MKDVRCRFGEGVVGVDADNICTLPGALFTCRVCNRRSRNTTLYRAALLSVGLYYPSCVASSYCLTLSNSEFVNLENGVVSP